MLEQIYQDFITNALSQIQAGLQITKEYFTELFGRYVKYLIAIDIMWLIIGMLWLIFTLVAIKKYWKIACENINDNGAFALYFVGIIISICTSSIISIYHIEQLVKDTYIPEIRVMEEIHNLTANHE